MLEQFFVNFDILPLRPDKSRTLDHCLIFYHSFAYSGPDRARVILRIDKRGVSHFANTLAGLAKTRISLKTMSGLDPVEQRLTLRDCNYPKARGPVSRRNVIVTEFMRAKNSCKEDRKLKHRPRLHLHVYAPRKTTSSGKHLTGFRTVVCLQEVIARLCFDVRSMVRLHDYAPSSLKRVSPAHILHPLPCSPSMKCLRVGGLRLNQAA